MKNNIKAVATASLAGFILGTTLTVSAGTWIQAYRNDEIKITLNGKEQTFRDATTNEIELPITYNNRTYLPLRSLATLLGISVDYDANTKTAILETKNDGKLRPKTIGEFFEDALGENGFQLSYGPDKSLCGFVENEIVQGCSVWCAVSEFEEKATASSTLKPQAGFSYEPSNVTNGLRKNAWIEGADGYGIGEYIELSQKYVVSDKNYGVDFNSLCIVNGYAENSEKWKNNSRVKELKMYYNGEFITNIELEDTIKPQYIDISSFGLNAKSGKEAKFKFEIVDVYKGEKYEDTAITAISFEIYTPNH